MCIHLDSIIPTHECEMRNKVFIICSRKLAPYKDFGGTPRNEVMGPWQVNGYEFLGCELHVW
jgi:hypothetical protein